MNWDRHSATWPNADCSRFVDVAGITWHLQRTGRGPGILLLHGAGASTHSFRDLIPLLATRAEVLALDLPGHGFTTRRSGGSALKPMARDIAALLDAERFQPTVIAGHSAGGAIALQMVLDGLSVRHMLGFNPALMPFQGIAGLVFPPLAKLLALNPLTPHVFARTAGTAPSVRNLIAGTGSRIEDDGLTLYRAVMSDPGHVDGALRMMAAWDLEPLLAALPGIKTPATFALGLNDRAVPPDTTRQQAARMPHATVLDYPDHGHLLHEEAPQLAADLAFSLIG